MNEPIENTNPFQSPQTDSGTATLPTRGTPPDHVPGLWSSEDLLIVERGTRLPDRCIVCNEPEEGTQLHFIIRRDLPVYAKILILVLASPLMLLVIFAGAKSVRTEIGLCRTHRQKELRGRWIVRLMFASLVVLPMIPLVATPVMGNETPTWLGLCFYAAILVFYLATLYLSFRWRPVRAMKIDEHFVWLAGVHPAYIERFSAAAPSGSN